MDPRMPGLPERKWEEWMDNADEKLEEFSGKVDSIESELKAIAQVVEQAEQKNPWEGTADISEAAFQAAELKAALKRAEVMSTLESLTTRFELLLDGFLKINDLWKWCMSGDWDSVEHQSPFADAWAAKNKIMAVGQKLLQIRDNLINLSKKNVRDFS